MAKKIIRRINVNEIKNPVFLKDFSYDELNVLAKDIRDNLIEQSSKNGGHLSSNLGVVELTIALHRIFNFEKDKLIFDIGHQCYTHKILTGRSLENLRQKDGVTGFQNMSESAYDHFEAGHSSTSISAAQGMAIARDLNNENYDVIAVIGDSAIANGMAFEALNSIGGRKNKVIIIINDNGMSISKSVGGLRNVFRRLSTSRKYNNFKENYRNSLKNTKFGKGVLNASIAIKRFAKRLLVQENIFEQLNYAYLGPIDGHNIKTIEKALKRAKNSPKSVVVHLKTVKGKGYKPAESDEIGTWHYAKNFDIKTGEPLKYKNNETWSKFYSDLVKAKIESNKKTILISPGTGKGSEIDEIFTQFPQNCIDVGIAEEHAVTLASGLSLNGYNPIVSIYSTFMQRGFDQISHDIARMKINSTFLVDRSGLIGSNGETHQGIFDENFLLATPNITVTMASNTKLAKLLFDESFNNHGPFFIRYPKSELKNSENNYDNFKYGNWVLEISNNSAKVAIGFGPVLENIKSLIISNNIDCDLVNAVYLSSFSEENMNMLLNRKEIIIFDCYGIYNGFVNLLKSKLIDLGYKGKIKSAAIPNQFIKCSTVDQQSEECGVSIEQIIELIKK